MLRWEMGDTEVGTEWDLGCLALSNRRSLNIFSMVHEAITKLSDADRLFLAPSKLTDVIRSDRATVFLAQDGGSVMSG
jgi:hypothetical protein